jgi:hypothetical protein
MPRLSGRGFFFWLIADQIAPVVRALSPVIRRQ